jgi:hypothetical protein
MNCDDCSSAALRGVSVYWPYASALVLRDVTVLATSRRGLGYFGESVGLDPETPLPQRDRCAGLLLKGTLLFLRGLSAAEVLSSQAQAAAAARW